MVASEKNGYLEQLQKKIKKGHGQGQGRDYIPWIKVHNFPSRGRSTRVAGWKTGRDHHLFSDLETSYFFILEWSPIVTDIREQYPLLPIEETLEIADNLGIKHPIDPETNWPRVITTDFFITVSDSYKVRTTKYAQELDSLRTIEKFEIERVYWERRNIDWGIVTEKEIPKILVDNIRSFHKAYHLESLNPDVMNRIRTHLENELLDRNEPLSDITIQTDEKFGLPDGTCLYLVNHFIARRIWQINLYEPIHPSKPLKLLNIGGLPVAYDYGGIQ